MRQCSEQDNVGQLAEISGDIHCCGSNQAAGPLNHAFAAARNIYLLGKPKLEKYPTRSVDSLLIALGSLSY